MKNIVLNHAAEPFSAQKLAFVLLVMGGILNVSLFFYQQLLNQKTHTLEAQLLQLTKPSRPRIFSQLSDQDNKNRLEETNAVNAAMKEINLPWQALFKALETTMLQSGNHTTIKLLTVEPNAQKGQLHLTAMAKEVDAMLYFLDDLSQQKIFKTVTLISQETMTVDSKTTDGKPAVQFSIVVGWQA